MKQHTDLITSSFTDFAGKVHHFVIAAISETMYHPAVVTTCDGIENIHLGVVSKGLKLGVSICNPEDTFNEEIGALKAISRAKKSPYTIFTSNEGLINTTVVKALLEQEATYLKNNPEKYIRGYAETRDRFFKNKKMESIKENFTEVEKIIVEGLQKDSKFLDNVQKYVTWINNQHKGKCKKSCK